MIYKRNKLRYFIFVLGAVFSISLSGAMILGKDVPTQAAVDLATNFKANRSTAVGYTQEMCSSPQTVHFIAKDHALALVKQGEGIEYVRYDGTPGAPIIKKVEQVGVLGTFENFSLVLYKLEKSIEDIVPFKKPFSYEQILELLNNGVYIFTRGDNPYDQQGGSNKNYQLKVAFASTAWMNQGMLEVLFQEESPKGLHIPSGFLISSADRGCALVASREDGFTLLGIGYKNSLGSDLSLDSNLPYAHSSYFIYLSDDMLEKLNNLLSNQSLQDLSHHQPIATGQAFKNQCTSTYTMSVFQSEGADQEFRNIFDHPVTWQVGDRVAISFDGTWAIKHPTGETERYLGLVPPGEDLGYPLSFTVQEVKDRGNGGIMLVSAEGSMYGIYPNGMVQKRSPDGKIVELYVNGWTCTRPKKDAATEWIYRSPQNPRLLGQRTYKGLKDIRTVCSDDRIKFKKEDATVIYTPRVTKILYENGQKDIAFPNGMVLTYTRGVDCPSIALNNSFRKEFNQDVDWETSDGEKFTLYVSDGRLERISKKRYRWTYHLNKNIERHSPKGNIKRSTFDGLLKVLSSKATKAHKKNRTAPAILVASLQPPVIAPLVISSTGIDSQLLAEFFNDSESVNASTPFSSLGSTLLLQTQIPQVSNASDAKKGSTDALSLSNSSARVNIRGGKRKGKQTPNSTGKDAKKKQRVTIDLCEEEDKNSKDLEKGS